VGGGGGWSGYVGAWRGVDGGESARCEVGEVAEQEKTLGNVLT
jgi:hypothetical protein